MNSSDPVTPRESNNDDVSSSSVDVVAEHAEEVSYDNETDGDQDLWRSVSNKAAQTFVAEPVVNKIIPVMPMPAYIPGSGWRTKLMEWKWLDFAKYNYYNRRKGTIDDLRFFVGANFTLLIALASARSLLNDKTDFWSNAYATLKLTFGDFGSEERFALQAFSVIVATVGFLGFALVLALVEQAFLEGLESNVKVGSPVFEAGHMLLLSFGRSPRDKEMLITICRQMCVAYSDVGGVPLVVLSETPKLEMEQLFTKVLPEDERRGSTLIFRQGNPLFPEDLRLVNASMSASTVVLGDQSRGAVEADAQSIRVAILLDELDHPTDGSPDFRSGHILVETFTMETLELINYACSSRVIPVATAKLNARRLARTLRQPIVGLATRRFWDFSSEARTSIENYPGLVGRTFKDICFSFADATPIGIVTAPNGSILLCPPSDYILQEGDEITMLRSGGSRHIQAASVPFTPPESSWLPTFARSDMALTAFASGDVCSGDEEALPMLQGLPPAASDRPAPAYPGLVAGRMKLGKSGKYIIPEQYTGSSSSVRSRPLLVLVCGWKNHQFMCALLRELDRGQSQLPLGSHVTFFNQHEPESSLELAESDVQPQNVTVDHTQGNPLKKQHLRRLNMQMFDCAVVLCDEKWLDPDEDISNGYDDVRTRADLLRLDSLVCQVQLHIRKSLEMIAAPDINIVCEKLAFGADTRFEDMQRLPLGIAVNFTSFSAKMLSFLAYYPKLLLPFFAVGELVDVTVFDSSWLCGEGEQVSYAELQARALKVRHVVIGYYELPSTANQGLQLVVNPMSLEERERQRVWNAASGRIKLVAMTPREIAPEKPLISRAAYQVAA